MSTPTPYITPPAEPRRALACPACRDTALVAIIETHEEVGDSDPGVVLYTEDGALIPASPFYFEPGHVLRVEARCDSCGHQWRPRRGRVAP